MNKEDIIRMAREAGWPDSLVAPVIMAKLAEFAAIVVAHEHEQIARMIEDAPPLMPFAQNDQGGCMMCGFTPQLAATTIRARTQKKPAG
jgi:hypothetical protein